MTSVIDINNAESIAAALAQMKQGNAEPMATADAVIEPENIQTAPGSGEPGPLTEQEAISIVQKRVTQDAQYESPSSFEELVEELQDAGEYRGTELSNSRLEEIVRTHAPDAPHRDDAPKSDKPSELPPYPSELTRLVESGVVFNEDGFWLARHCRKCGQFKKDKCCGELDLVSVTQYGDQKTLNSFGRQAAGIDPIKVPKPPATLEEIRQGIIQNLDKNPWWKDFSGTDELQGNANVKMLIENFLPEGLTLICGLPKEGKSFLALSVAKALTSGRPLFGRVGFEVPETIPVLYLAAESGDSALKLRCEKMNITKDKTRFICRTLSKGLMLSLDDTALEQAIRAMRPVVILETLIRFNDGTDEDSSTENRKLAENLFRLIAWGARAVIGIHHSRKDLNKHSPTKEAAVRGSGDGLAMVDAVWLVMQDERSYQGGRGPNEIDVVGWGRDFNPVPMRLRLTKKAPKDVFTKLFAPGIVSTIDLTGDMEWVDQRIVSNQDEESIDQVVERLVVEDPSISRKKLVEDTKSSEWEVRNSLKRLGYHRAKGGKKGASPWIKTRA
jgi:AAA domain-containing protein